MSTFSLTVPSPDWVYEGLDPNLYEYASGIVVNRSPKQIQANVTELVSDLNTWADNLNTTLGTLTLGTNYWGGSVGGTSNALSITIPSVTSYYDGLLITFTPTTPNTSAVTIAINSLPAIPLVRDANIALGQGVLLLNKTYTVVYSNSKFRLVGSSGVLDLVDGGTSYDDSSTQISLRRDTSAAWEANNTILSAGELGVEIDTALQKTGDGVSEWNSLPYTNQKISSNAAIVYAIALG